ncbi:ankyrin repeat-containing domain protein [Xylaria digitata]|nr:ankyrin repeat-containing domain protein [Xylaria digitata]
MEPPASKPSEEEWLRHKELIRRLYIVDGIPLKKLTDKLRENGLNVTNHQLEYKLKQWKFRKNIDKMTWVSIDRHISKRKRDNKKSEVIYCGKRMKPSTVEKETDRHRDVTIFARLTQPRSPSPISADTQVIICTPQPPSVEFQWPGTLPWLKFSADKLRILPNTRWAGNRQAESSWLLQPALHTSIFLNALDLALHHESTDSSPGISKSVAILGTSMPEVYPGEHLQRAQCLLHGPKEEKFTECLTMLIYNLSNNMVFHFPSHAGFGEQWEAVLAIVRECGILDLQVDLKKFHSATIDGFIENLFLGAIRALTYSDESEAEGALIVVKWVLRLGQNPNIRCGHFCTPLQLAAKCLNSLLLEHLLDAGADTNLVTPGHHDCSRPPLQLALESRYSYEPTANKLHIAQMLLQHGASANSDRDLCPAIERGYSEIAKAILQKGVSGSLDKALHLAILHRHTEIIKILLQQGVPENLDKALHYAIRGGNSEVVKILVQQGANLGAHFGVYVGDRPIGHLRGSHDAYFSNHPGPNPWFDIATDFCGYFKAKNLVYEVTTLCLAAGTGLQETKFVLNILRSQNPLWATADLITTDVLISAAAAGNNDTLLFLYHFIRDRAIPANVYGITPLHAAAIEGHLSTCELLFPLYGLYAQKSSFPSPLWLACHRGHAETAKFFIKQNIYNVNTAVASAQFAAFLDPLRLYLPIEKWGSTSKSLETLINPEMPHHILTSDLECACILIRAGAELTGHEVILGAKMLYFDLLSAALAVGASANVQDKLGISALQHALKSHSDFLVITRETNRYSIVEILLQKGATLLGDEVASAIRLGDWDLMDLLLKYGGSILDKGANGTAALEAAVVSRPSWVHRLLEAHPRIYDAGALCAAIATKNDSIIEQLLANRPLKPIINEIETTAVGLAAWSGSLGLLRKLLSNLQFDGLARVPGVANFMKNNDSLGCFWHSFPSRSLVPSGSPLALAARGEGVQAMQAFRELLRNGRKPDRLTWFVIAERDNLPLAQILYEQGHKLESYDYMSLDPIPNPLLGTIRRHNMALALLLVKAGADVNDYNREQRLGRSPLQLAAEQGNLEMVDYLLNAGADINALPCSDGGGTALQLAAMKGYLGLVKYLLEHGADVNAPAGVVNGRTALEVAAENGRLDMLQLILSYDALVTGTGRYQYVRAVVLANSSGFHTAAKLLKSYGGWSKEEDEVEESIIKDYLQKIPIVAEVVSCCRRLGLSLRY